MSNSNLVGPVIAAFLRGEEHPKYPREIANTRSDGTRLYLHGNVIAEINDGKTAFRITLAGWNTVLTRHRLSLLPGVSVSRCEGSAMLNGEPWDGEWKKFPIHK